MSSCISGVEDYALYDKIHAVNFYFGSSGTVVELFAIQGSGLECLQFRGWIRGVSVIQGSGLEGCPQFRGLD